MKNVHLIPTDKPSRLGRFVDTGNLFIRTDNDIPRGENVEIYITSEEEIKEGDWIFSLKTNNIFKADSIEYLKSHNMIEDFDKSFYINSKSAKKIILTTDEDLIAGGVQAIDDAFLEWFVNNSSCEYVEIEKTFVTNSGLGYQEYAVLSSDFKVLEVVATIPQFSYKIGEVTKLDAYEYITQYKIISYCIYFSTINS